MNRLKRLIEHIKSFYHPGGRYKAISSVFFELLQFYWLNEKVVIEYFFLGLHKKGSNLNNFLARKEFHKIHDQLNPKYYRAILEDKYVFDKYMEGLGFPIVESLGYIEGGKIFLKSSEAPLPVNDIQNMQLDCFCKIHTGCGGESVFKLQIENNEIKINNKNSTLSLLKNILKQGLFVLQKTITQHSDLNQLNSNCINSIRVYTVNIGETYKSLGGFMRIGRGNNVVDNTAMGNLTCPWDDRGKLCEEAFEFIPNRKFHTKHPDNNFIFKGFEIPYFKEFNDLTLKMHSHLPFFFIIGWDVAISTNGIQIIEANPVADLAFIQAYFGGIRKQFVEMANSFAAHKQLNCSF